MSDTDTRLRTIALSEANKGIHNDPNRIVERAQAYFDFLSGPQDVKSNHTPEHPSERVNSDHAAIRDRAYNQAIDDVLSLRDQYKLNEDDEIVLRDATAAISKLRR
jgi:hypothetical protein